MSTVSLGIVIPTRNRAQLAINACQSLLAQPGCDFRVFVSDNSTQPEELARLSSYCAGAGTTRLIYLKPPQPLPMATHWDWALRTAMAAIDATHFNVHYDRRITKPGHLALVCEVMSEFPDDVVTWTLDVIADEPGVSVVGQIPWDGNVYAVPTARVVEMTVKGQIAEMGQAFPILSNCAVPRPVLSNIVQRFGSICDSTAPDSSFTYRFCATHDRYLHFDRPIGIIYGFDRSTGAGFMRGQGGDFPDFMEWWGDRPWLDAAPIPGLNLGQNVLFHEYELVRRVTENPAFLPVERDGYLRELASSLKFVDDRPRASALRDILLQHGWDPKFEPVKKPRMGAATGPRVRDGLPWLRRFILDTLDQVLAGRGRAMRMKIRLALEKHFRVELDDITGFEYSTEAEAVRQTLALPRKRSATNPLLDWLDGVDVLSLGMRPETAPLMRAEDA